MRCLYVKLSNKLSNNPVTKIMVPTLILGAGVISTPKFYSEIMKKKVQVPGTGTTNCVDGVLYTLTKIPIKCTT